MKYVYLLIDKATKNVAAIYDDETLAKKLKKPIEDKLKVELEIEKRSLNLDIKTVGVFR